MISFYIFKQKYCKYARLWLSYWALHFIFWYRKFLKTWIWLYTVISLGWVGRPCRPVVKKCFSHGWVDCPWFLLKHAVNSFVWVDLPFLLLNHAINSLGWVNALTIVKTCCQEPWLVILAMTVAKTSYQEPWLKYNGHDCCRNMLSTAIVESLGHDSGLG